MSNDPNYLIWTDIKDVLEWARLSVYALNHVIVSNELDFAFS